MFHAAAAGHPSQVVGTQMQFPCESLDPLTQLSGADLANKPGSCTGLLVQGRAAVWPHPGEGAMSQQTGRKSLKDPDPNPPNSIPFRSVPFHSILFHSVPRFLGCKHCDPSVRAESHPEVLQTTADGNMAHLVLVDCIHVVEKLC